MRLPMLDFARYRYVKNAMARPWYRENFRCAQQSPGSHAAPHSAVIAVEGEKPKPTFREAAYLCGGFIDWSSGLEPRCGITDDRCHVVWEKILLDGSLLEERDEDRGSNCEQDQHRSRDRYDGME